MMRSHALAFGFVLVAAVAVAACGGQGDFADRSGDEPVSPGAETASQQGGVSERKMPPEATGAVEQNPNSQGPAAARVGAATEVRLPTPKPAETTQPFGIDGDWNLTGNGGTNPANNFLGTTDSVPLELRVASVRTMRLEPGFNLIVGYNGNSVASGSVGATIAGGGKSTSINQVFDNYGFVGGGVGNSAGQTGSVTDNQHATVSGGYGNTAAGSTSTVSGGMTNTAGGIASVVAGGQVCAAAGNYSAVAGGQYNEANGVNSAVAGGYDNTATGGYTAVGGGYLNTAGGDYAAITGGKNNTANGLHAFIGGGQANDTSADHASVAGGYDNTAGALYGVVGGGYQNSVEGTYGSVVGGRVNVAGGAFSHVGGGESNEATATHCTVAGGYDNSASYEYSAVGGGYYNRVNAVRGTIAGGSNNLISTNGYSAIGGGQQNQATGGYAAIAGGYNNSVSATSGAIGGGSGNSVTGQYGTVAGGLMNAASTYSFSAGCGSSASHSGSFVFGGDCAYTISSIANNSFVVRATGGARFYTTTNGGGVGLNTGSGSWYNLSDRNSKADIVAIDARDVLRRVTSTPVFTWSYKEEPGGIRHMGPMAQDFYAAFKLGTDDKTITTIDADGVALAAIQGLDSIVREQAARIDSLDKRNTDLARDNADLKTRMDKLEQALAARPLHASSSNMNSAWLGLGAIALGGVFIASRRKRNHSC